MSGSNSRQYYQKHLDLVTVKRIRLTSACVVEAGTDIDRTKFRDYHLRTLYAQRRIGVKNTPWSNAMIANAGKRKAYCPELAIGDVVVPEVVVELPPTMMIPEGWGAAYLINEVTVPIEVMLEIIARTTPITIVDWNATATAEQAGMLMAVHTGLTAGETYSEDVAVAEVLTPNGDVADDSNVVINDEAEAPLAPVNVGRSKWAIEGVEEVFTTKTLALEYLASL